jgi:hypothetical protein
MLQRAAGPAYGLGPKGWCNDSEAPKNMHLAAHNSTAVHLVTDCATPPHLAFRRPAVECLSHFSMLDAWLERRPLLLERRVVD